MTQSTTGLVEILRLPPHEKVNRGRGDTQGLFTEAADLLSTQETTIAELVAALEEAQAPLAWIMGQCESAMAISAGAASTSGDPEGALQMLNSIASDVAINADMLSEKLEALTKSRSAL